MLFAAARWDPPTALCVCTDWACYFLYFVKVAPLMPCLFSLSKESCTWSSPGPFVFFFSVDLCCAFWKACWFLPFILRMPIAPPCFKSKIANGYAPSRHLFNCCFFFFFKWTIFLSLVLFKVRGSRPNDLTLKISVSAPQPVCPWWEPRHNNNFSLRHLSFYLNIGHLECCFHLRPWANVPCFKCSLRSLINGKCKVIFVSLFFADPRPKSISDPNREFWDPLHPHK